MEHIEKVVLVKEKASDELFDAKETLERLDYYNEKVSFLISEWISNYSFNEKPDPYFNFATKNKNMKGRVKNEYT